jgi:hypothetical protein
MTSSSLTENKAFAERIFDRIKDGLGDLMTDDELKVLLDRAVNEAFFKPRLEPIDRWSSVTKEIPSHFVTMTRELMDKQVQQQVNDYFEAHADEIKQKVADVLQQGIGAAVLAAIASQMQQPISALHAALASKNLL